MQETWRWFGPKDPVPWPHIRQAGATGVVSALHHISPGHVWGVGEIQLRQKQIEQAGFQWTVVETLPVSEDIKTQSGSWRQHLEAYRQSLVNLARCGLRTVCFNFMPLLDWTRTDQAYRLPDGSITLRFDADAFAAFDLFILGRKEAEQQWGPQRVHRAHVAFETMDSTDRAKLTRTIISGLPGAEEHYTLDMLRTALRRYAEIDAARLRSHLADFLLAVVPTAAELRMRLCIHPDDPPYPLLGLPRIVSTANDVRWLLAQTDPTSFGTTSGLTFCAGSFGVRPDNDLPAIVEEFGPRIHFVHLRNIRREAGAGDTAEDAAELPLSFHESPHLDGDVNMVAVVKALQMEERHRRRRDEGRADAEIPMRPDHGQQMLDDLPKLANPGYSAIGRLKGLAELRGVARAVEQLA